jgi:hypothetical protein
LGLSAIQFSVGSLYFVCTFLFIVIAPSGACIIPAGGGGAGTGGPRDEDKGGGGGQGGGGGGDDAGEVVGISGGGGGMGIDDGFVLSPPELLPKSTETKTDKLLKSNNAAYVQIKIKQIFDAYVQCEYSLL